MTTAPPPLPAVGVAAGLWVAVASAVTEAVSQQVGQLVQPGFPVQLVLQASTGALGSLTTGDALVVSGSVTAGTPLAADRVDYALDLSCAGAGADTVTYALWAMTVPPGGGALVHVQGSPVGPLSGDSSGVLTLAAGSETVVFALQVTRPGAWQYVFLL